MDALVHFSVGVACGLLVLTAVDLRPRVEFPLAFASGVWALVPDGHWMLSEVGLAGPASVWKAFHATAVANVFWLHRLIDLSETARPKLEQGIALAGLLVAVTVYYAVNDWKEK